MTKLKRNTNLNTDVVFTAFDYQDEAYVAIREKDYSAVFHEQGLGKTKIALDTILYWFRSEKIDSVIIVTKRSLVANWQEEIKTHTHIVPTVLSQNRKLNFYAFNSPIKLYICHYEVVNSELERLKIFCKTRDIAMVLDESQKIKNPESKLTRSFHTISPFLKHRIIMSGTPISNRPYDIWSQIFFLDGGKALGDDFNYFKENLDLTGDLGGDDQKRIEFESNLGKIWDKVKPFSVRETKAGAGIDLPEKHIETIQTGWEDRQECMYSQVRDETRVTLVQDGIPIDDESDDILKRLLRLIQIASNPAVIDESYGDIPGKFTYLLSLLTRIVDNSEKAIVWTSFIKNAEWLKKHLSDFQPCLVHGSIPIATRNQNIQHFKTDPSRKILIATPGAAKEGLTLTNANHVIFYDRTFSLDDYLQAQDRIHRISQKKDCYVYNFLMKNSIDEWVNVLIQAKHLAAKFGQGDINLDEYQSESDYSFQDVLSKILSGEGVIEDD